MLRSPHIRVDINLGTVVANAQAIAARTGVPVIAVVKADAYGLGAVPVVRALAEVVEAFYTFSPAEALDAGIPATGKTTIAMLHHSVSPAELAAAKIRPAVFSLAEARAYAAADPVLSVDVGMQRFGCPPDESRSVLRAGLVSEVLAHGVKPEHVERFAAVVDEFHKSVGVKRHLAASALLGHPSAYMDATRPGLALYAGAVRVSTRLFDARDSSGPAGYTGFLAARHGVMIGGYSNGMRRGIVHINGTPRRILEVGMQSAFIELEPQDKVGDEVLLLGDGLTEALAAESTVAAGLPLGAHELLLKSCGMGTRHYV